ncbi:MAG: BspA family leucine-rich repeat surface protein [Bacilli bacterium]|nr:BspA family leucine-rich repeat surface protein [Bacilli bacterium]
MRRKKLKKIYIVLFFFISIGFAYLSTNLFINGSALLKKNSWNIYFDNVEVQEESIELSSEDIAPTIDQDKTTVSYQVSFNSPGDYYIFNIDTVNDGTYHAEIKLIEKTDIPEGLQNIADVRLEYLDGTEPKVGDVLMAGSIKTIKVITGFKEDIETTDLPTEVQSMNMSISITYEFIREEDIKVTKFIEGSSLNDKIYELAGVVNETSSTSSFGGTTSTYYKGSLAYKSFKKATEMNPDESECEIVSTEDSLYPIYLWFEEDTNTNDGTGDIYWYTEAKEVFFNEDSKRIFSGNGFSNNSEHTSGHYDPDLITDLSSLSNINTSKVTDFDSTFSECLSLVNFDFLKNWNVTNVEKLEYTFFNTGIINLNVFLNWKLNSLTSLDSTFSGNDELVDITGIRNWDVSKVTNFISTFDGNSKLETLNGLQDWDVSKGENFLTTFECNDKLKDITALANWHFNEDEIIESMQCMFFQCYELESLNGLQNWNVENVDWMESMFADCYLLTDISALADWEFTNVTGIGSMFDDCHSLTDISPLLNWDTSNIEYFWGIFESCTSLQSAHGVENWTFTNSDENSINGLFTNCTSLTDISALANWDTTPVRNISYLFEGCTSLTDISPLQNWNVSNVTKMIKTFYECTSLSNINALQNWNVSSVTNFGSSTWYGGTFQNCTSLIDARILNGWAINSNADMTYMFYQSGVTESTKPTWYTGNL